MLFAGKRARPPSSIHIGIAGLDHNIGATTLSIALANYLCSKRRKTVAYLELGAPQIASLSGSTLLKTNPQSSSFFHLPSAKVKASGAKGEPCFFTLLDVDYYPQVALQSLPYLYGRGYQYYILDLGIINPHVETEFLRCDTKLLLCDFAPWKADLTNLLLQDMTKDITLQRSITILTKGGHLIPSRSFTADYEYRFLDFPCFPNPFQLTPEVFDFFEKLITGV